MANKTLEKSTAKSEITEAARDYLTAKITLPLGNPELKNLHTNQFLFTALPTDFPLKNWEVIANALNSADTRFADYRINRWYVEGTQINVTANGNAEISIDVNAFPSSVSEYSEGRKSFTDAYVNATTQQNTAAKQTSSSKKTTNAVANKNTTLIKKDWVKKYNISSTIVKQVEKICKVSNSDYTNVKAIFKWMDDHLPYEGYGNTKYGAVGTLKRGKGNCCDHAHLFAAMCRCLGVKCNYIHNPCCGSGGHVYNKVYLNGKGTIVDTGRDCASWGSHWGNAGCPTEKTSISF